MIRKGSLTVVLIAALAAPGTVRAASAPATSSKTDCWLALRQIGCFFFRVIRPFETKTLVIDSDATFTPPFRTVSNDVPVPPLMKARVLDGMKLIVGADGSWTLIYRIEVIGRHDVNVSWRLTLCNGDDVLATILTPRKHIKVTDDKKRLKPITQTGQSDALRRVFKRISEQKPLKRVVVRPQTCLEKILSAVSEWIRIKLFCAPPCECPDDATILLRAGSTVEFELTEHDAGTP